MDTEYVDVGIPGDKFDIALGVWTVLRNSANDEIKGVHDFFWRRQFWAFNMGGKDKRHPKFIIFLFVYHIFIYIFIFSSFIIYNQLTTKFHTNKRLINLLLSYSCVRMQKYYSSNIYFYKNYILTYFFLNKTQSLQWYF